MTKKYKNISKREVIKLSASFLIALFIFTGCKKDVSSIGGDINPNGLTLLKQDTFSIITKSIILDSLPTDETSISLLGGLNDPELGIVDCGIVTQVRLSSEAPNFGNISDIIVDSVILSFKYAGELYYGSLGDLSFEVLEITDQLNRDDDTYYSYTPVNTTGANLITPGKEVQKPSPYTKVYVGDDTLEPMLRLNLNTTFGDYLINNSSEMSTNDNFISFFKGLYVKVTGANNLAENKGTVLSLSLENALSNLILYYTISGENKKFTFNINNNSARYNKIDFNHAGTPLSVVLSDETASQEKIYLQNSHIRPEFHFPYIKTLADKGNIIINKAELIIPVQNFDESPFNISKSLFIGRVSNNLETSLTYDYPTFNSINYDKDSKSYRFNLTRDLQRVVSGDIENVGYRVYPTNFFGSSIGRTIFSGPNATSKEKTKLVITYTEY